MSALPGARPKRRGFEGTTLHLGPPATSDRKEAGRRRPVVITPVKDRNSAKSREGQAFLELTLLLPLVFLLIAGIIAIGLALSYKLKVEAVAREVTRVIAKNTGGGSVQLGLGRAEEVARQYGFDPAGLQIRISGVGDTATPPRGGKVEATVTYHYQLFNFIAIDITGTNTEVVECWRKRGDENSGGTCVPPDEQSLGPPGSAPYSFIPGLTGAYYL